MGTNLLNCCLYFTANNLARIMTNWAEEEFKITGLSPNQAFIILIVCETPRITPLEIADYLSLSPSTITRFIDKLEIKNLVSRSVEGKRVVIEPTPNGQKLVSDINKAWHNLYHKYSQLIGYEEGKRITSIVGETAKQLLSPKK